MLNEKRAGSHVTTPGNPSERFEGSALALRHGLVQDIVKLVEKLCTKIKKSMGAWKFNFALLGNYDKLSNRPNDQRNRPTDTRVQM